MRIEASSISHRWYITDEMGFVLEIFETREEASARLAAMTEAA